MADAVAQVVGTVIALINTILNGVYIQIIFYIAAIEAQQRSYYHAVYRPDAPQPFNTTAPHQIKQHRLRVIILVVGSGNMIHNLRMVSVQGDDFNAGYGYDWAIEMNEIFKRKINENDVDALIDYPTLHHGAKLAIPTPDHYLPLLYILGMRNEKDSIRIFNDKVIAGSLSMTSVLIGDEL